MARTAELERKTNETQIRARLGLDGRGCPEISTGIGFFDHMLTLFCVHGRMDLEIDAVGDLEVDMHHTVEDVGLVLGELIDRALGDRRGITRYGHAVIPMDEALAEVSIDLSNRPYLVVHLPPEEVRQNGLDDSLMKEFFRAVAQRAGMNLHIRLAYGENWHHMIEAVFKGAGRALRQAATIDPEVKGVPSTKGVL